MADYTVEDAYKAINPPTFQFTCAGAKPIRGKKYKNMPSYFELNMSRDQKVSIKRLKDGAIRIIIPLPGRTIGDDNFICVRGGDSFVLELENITDDEAIEITNILSRQVKYDVQKIQSNDIQEGIDVLKYVAKELPAKINARRKKQESH